MRQLIVNCNIHQSSISPLNFLTKSTSVLDLFGDCYSNTSRERRKVNSRHKWWLICESQERWSTKTFCRMQSIPLSPFTIICSSNHSQLSLKSYSTAASTRKGKIWGHGMICAAFILQPEPNPQLRSKRESEWDLIYDPWSLTIYW